MNSTKSFFLLSIPVVLFLSLTVCTGCAGKKDNPADPQNQTSSEIPFDTVLRVQIENRVNEINAGLREIGAPQKIPYTIYNPSDTLYYWIVGENSARISIEWNPPKEVVWPTFYVDKGELILVRFRYMSEDATYPQASETFVYLDQGKIVYCNERRMEIKEGQYPGMLRAKPHERSTRTYAEIEKDYKPYWEQVRKHMEENNALPAFIK